jgi:lactate racemase
LFYVPGLPREYYATLWGRAFNTAAAALEALSASLTPGAAVAVIPEGPYVLARASAEVAV